MWDDKAQTVFEALKTALKSLSVLVVLNKSVYEKGLMAVVLAIQKWRHYLLGRHFVVHTNQRSWRYLTEQRLLGEEQHRWMSKLLGFDFEIKYKCDIEDKASDALSQKFPISTVRLGDWAELDEEVAKDVKQKQILQGLLIVASTHVG